METAIKSRIALFLFLLGSAYGALSIQAPRADAWVDSYNPEVFCNELQTRQYDSFFQVMKDDGVYTFDKFIRYHIDHPENGSTWTIDAGNGNQSYVIVGQADGLGGTDYVFYAEKDPNANIHFRNDRITIPSSHAFTGVIVPTEDNRWYISTLTDFTNGQEILNQQAEATCIHKATNVTYQGDYIGPLYSDYNDALYEEPECDTFDIGCHIGNIFQGVANTFLGVGQAILEGIMTIVIPDGDALVAAFSQIATALTDTLGFIVYPITWLINTATAMQNAGTSTGSISFGQFFGANFVVDFQAPLQALGWLTPLFVFAKAGIVLQLMFLLWHKYRDIVSS
jgi:hypothetical protein